MEKITIRKRYLDCIKKKLENEEFYSNFPNDWEERLKRSIQLREEFSDIIPIGNDIIQNCKEYIYAMNNENYEICQKFLIVD
jgi:hypothetical protein